MTSQAIEQVNSHCLKGWVGVKIWHYRKEGTQDCGDRKNKQKGKDRGNGDRGRTAEAKRVMGYESIP